jgi:DNA-binding CsgD family transcriptional regulator
MCGNRIKFPLKFISGLIRSQCYGRIHAPRFIPFEKSVDFLFANLIDIVRQYGDWYGHTWMHCEGLIMRRSAYLASRRSPSTLRTKTRGEVFENSIRPERILRRDRSILSPNAWRRIAISLRISDRELQIIQEIFDDRKEFAIARDLAISVHTVHTHLERLYRKLGVSTRVGLIVYILAEYLSSLPATL